SGWRVLLAATVFVRNLYCRFLCPVGAALGLLSKLTVFGIKRWSECNTCKICEKTCEWGAIRGPQIVMTECVRCDDCERLYADTVKCPHWIIIARRGLRPRHHGSTRPDLVLNTYPAPRRRGPPCGPWDHRSLARRHAAGGVYCDIPANRNRRARWLRCASAVYRLPLLSTAMWWSASKLPGSVPSSPQVSSTSSVWRFSTWMCRFAWSATYRYVCSGSGENARPAQVSERPSSGLTKTCRW
ncbi:Regulatory protein NosR, partial [Geodia barretti]